MSFRTGKGTAEAVPFAVFDQRFLRTRYRLEDPCDTYRKGKHRRIHEKAALRIFDVTTMFINDIPSFCDAVSIPA